MVQGKKREEAIEIVCVIEIAGGSKEESEINKKEARKIVKECKGNIKERREIEGHCEL